MPSWARNSATPEPFGGTVSGGVDALIFALIATGGKKLSFDQPIKTLTAAPAHFTPYISNAGTMAAVKASPTFSLLSFSFVVASASTTIVPVLKRVAEATEPVHRLTTAAPCRPVAENRPASGRDR